MKITILILPGYSQKWDISGESLAQNLTKGKLNKYSALLLVLISRPVWFLILVHFYLSSLFLLFSKIVCGIISTCFYIKKAKISLFSHHWRTSDLVPCVLLLVQTKVSHLSTLAHFNVRARILSWLKLQTRPHSSSAWSFASNLGCWCPAFYQTLVLWMRWSVKDIWCQAKGVKVTEV